MTLLSVPAGKADTELANSVIYSSHKQRHDSSAHKTQSSKTQASCCGYIDITRDARKISTWIDMRNRWRRGDSRLIEYLDQEQHQDFKQQPWPGDSHGAVSMST